MKRHLLQTTAFIRALKRNSKNQAALLESIREVLLCLESDAFQPRLRTHKLKGGMAGKWACSAGYDLRIVFQIVHQRDEEAILLLSVGTHDEVY